MDMFESVAADMARDGLLLDSSSARAAAAGDSSATATLGVAVEAVPTAAAAAGPTANWGVSGGRSVLTGLLLPPTGLRKSPHVAATATVPAALLAGQRDLDVQRAVDSLHAMRPQAVAAAATLAAEGCPAHSITARSASVEGVVSDTHAALDTAALFAFAGDLE